jgi:hypothetical protein
MERDPAAETTSAMDFSASSSTAASMNGYGSSGHDDTDVLILVGAAFVGGLLLGALVSRIAS